LCNVKITSLDVIAGSTRQQDRTISRHPETVILLWTHGFVDTTKWNENCSGCGPLQFLLASYFGCIFLIWTACYVELVLGLFNSICGII